MPDEQIIEKLSAYADGELDAQAAGEIEHTLAQDATLRTCLTQFRAMDKTASALPVPRMSQSAGAAVWQAVRARTTEGAGEDLTPANLHRVESTLAEPPTISEERWRRTWTSVRAQTTDARLQPIDADLTPGPLHAAETVNRAQARRSAAPIPMWRSAAALAAAAVILVVATVAFLRQDPPKEVENPGRLGTAVAVSTPEALDKRYFVMVQHVPGIEQPVVCFFLKEPDPELEEIESWQ